MRILFVGSGKKNNDISPILRNQGNSLIKKGIHVDYFSIDQKGLFGYLMNTFKIRKKVKSNNYSLIHAHFGLSGIVSLIAKTKNDKLIVSYMGSDIHGFIKSDGRISSLSKFFSLLSRMQIIYFNDWSIVKSKEMHDILKIKKKISVIPNGVDFNLFFPLPKIVAREKLKIDKNIHMAIFVSDPNRKEKNYPTAKSAVNLLSNPVELRVVHDVTQEILNLYYNAADLLLFTSIKEGSPNVIKEAMACNCPIVATAVGDVAEIISGTDGCYIVSNHPQDIAEKIKKVLQFNRRTQGRKNISHLESSQIADQIINIYKMVLMN